MIGMRLLLLVVVLLVAAALVTADLDKPRRRIKKKIKTGAEEEAEQGGEDGVNTEPEQTQQTLEEQKNKTGRG